MLSSTGFKIPQAYSANTHVAARVAALAVLTGKGLPCKVVQVLIGPLVTVSFQVDSLFNIPNITMPVAGMSQYIRTPIQVGEVGRAVPTGGSVAAISGLGTGTPNLGPEGNLATLVFQPISSTISWPTINQPNSTVIYGVSGGGVIMQDQAVGPVTTVTFNHTGVTITTTGPVNITGSPINLNP